MATKRRIVLGQRSFSQGTTQLKNSRQYNWCGVWFTCWDGYYKPGYGKPHHTTQFQTGINASREEVLAAHARTLAAIQAGEIEKPTSGWDW